MKIFTYVSLIFSVIIIGFNIYLIDFSNPFQGLSGIAFISAVMAFLALLLLLIFHFSRKRQEKLK